MTYILHRQKLDDVGAEYLTNITANVMNHHDHHIIILWASSYHMMIIISCNQHKAEKTHHMLYFRKSGDSRWSNMLFWCVILIIWWSSCYHMTIIIKQKRPNTCCILKKEGTQWYQIQSVWLSIRPIYYTFQSEFRTVVCCLVSQVFRFTTCWTPPTNTHTVTAWPKISFFGLLPLSTYLPTDRGRCKRCLRN